MMSEKLGCAQLTFASKVSVDPGAKKVSITRVTEAGVDEVHGEFLVSSVLLKKLMNRATHPLRALWLRRKRLLMSVTLQVLARSSRNRGQQ